MVQSRSSDGVKTCKCCKVEKPIAEFPSSSWSTRNDGTKTKSYKPQCKLCFNQLAKDQFERLLSELKIELKCKRCGYDRCHDALDFHHKDPNEKDFNISSRWSISIENFRTEIEKCVALCANCHRELHAGLWCL